MEKNNRFQTIYTTLVVGLHFKISFYFCESTALIVVYDADWIKRYEDTCTPQFHVRHIIKRSECYDVYWKTLPVEKSNGVIYLLN